MKPLTLIIVAGCIVLIACPALAQSNSRADEEISQSRLALSAFECSLLATDNKEARRLFDIGFAAGKKFLDETSKLTADERTRVTGQMDLLWWGAWDGASDVVGPTWKPSTDFLGHSFWGPTIDFILGRVFSERAQWAYKIGGDAGVEEFARKMNRDSMYRKKNCFLIH
jgi:hypothetical protein